MLSALFVLSVAALSGVLDSTLVRESRNEARVSVDQLAAPSVSRPQNPTIQCGLVVWHVDASADPKIVVHAPPWNLDPKILLKPSGPCAKPK